MSQEKSSPTLPRNEVQEASFTLHPSIDYVLARDKSRRAKSNDPGWKYAWWPTLGDKNTM